MENYRERLDWLEEEVKKVIGGVRLIQIGRRYRRQDEIGTPYCVTVDFDSLEDKKVTVCDRDTMKQERIAIAELKDYLKNKFD